MSLEALEFEGYFTPLPKEYTITVRRADGTSSNVTAEVIDLFRRILELTPTDEGQRQVRANARNHFGIDFREETT